MEIKHLKPSELKPYEHNNRKHPANQIEKLCKQIKAHGFDVPIVVDANNVIIKGHARHAAAKKLKLKTVPVIIRADLTPEQCAAARLADNKLSELAEIDMVAIQAELDALQAINFDLDLTAFDRWNPFAVDAEEGTEGLTDPDDVPELKLDPKSKLGDVWVLGNHRVMCGDSTDAASVAILMNGQKADITFTSPPYNAGKSAKLSGNTNIDDCLYGENYDDDQDDDNYFELLRKSTQNSIANSRYQFWNIQFLAGNRCTLPKYWAHFTKNICDVAIWNKGHAAPQQAARVLNSVFEFIFIFTSDDKPSRAIRCAPEFHGNVSNVFDIPPQRQNEFAKIHGATFPVAFPEFIASKFCENSVLDLFLGSGSTLIACEKTGRHCYGMELSPQYVDVIIKRWQDFTGKKAIREDGTEFDTL